MYSKRTDLAAEARQIYAEQHGDALDGLQSEVYFVGGTEVTKITVSTQAGADAIGKPCGTYVTVALDGEWLRRSDTLISSARVIAGELSKLLPDKGPVLVVGLGNRAITPDSIGPHAVENIIVTRHLIESLPEEFAGMREVCAISTGVLGLTGIETAEIVRGVAQRVKPGVIIAIDALASRSVDRLCHSFQIADTGITPGGGAYNSRAALTCETLGVPVVAVGVPTVVDAFTLAADVLEKSGMALPDPERLISRQGLLVTPKDIDVLVQKSGKAIGYAINMALQGDLSASDIEQFLP